MDFQKDIIHHEELLLAAMKSSDLPALEALLHDDLIFTNHDGEVMTKEMDLDTHRKEDFAILDITTSEQVVHTIDDTGIVSVKKYIAGEYRDQSFDGTFRFTRVWKKFDDGWKVIAASSVST